MPKPLAVKLKLLPSNTTYLNEAEPLSVLRMNLNGSVKLMYALVEHFIYIVGKWLESDTFVTIHNLRLTHISCVLFVEPTAFDEIHE